MKPPIARLLCLLLLPPLSGCGSVTLAGAAGFDAGTFGVPRVKTGVGSHIEAIRYVRDGHSDVGLGAAFELAGHATGNDADPLFFTTLEFRYRRAFGVTIAPNQPYWEIGTGVGIPWRGHPRCSSSSAGRDRPRAASWLGACVGGRARAVCRPHRRRVASVGSVELVATCFQRPLRNA